MPRRRRPEKRVISPDIRYGDAVVSKFINNLMWEGKKLVASSIFYDSLESVSTKLGREPVELFHAALANVKPAVEVRSRRVGGATYQVPIPVSPHRALILAIRWMITASRGRPEKTMVERLSGEIRNAVEGVGAAVKKRTDIHRMAEANKAFSHYR
jgi:small subunit ribosomal protein S7